MDVDGENLSYTTDPKDTFKLIEFAESNGEDIFIDGCNKFLRFDITNDVKFERVSDLPKSITIAFILAFEKE